MKRSSKYLFQMSVITAVLALPFERIATSAPNANKKKNSQTEGTAPKDPNILPIHVKSCSIEDEVRVASRVISREFYEARSDYSVTIEAFNVKKGDVVKKGQLLVSTNTSNIKQMLGIYQDYAGLYEGQLRVAKTYVDLAVGRRDRLKGLVAKGIIPQAEFDTAEKQVISVKGQQQQMERGLAEMKKSVKDYSEQIRKANFYSDIDGIVTQLVVDPRSVSGTLQINSGTVIVRVDKPGRYRAEAQLLDTQIHEVQNGMKADVILPDGSKIEGKITFVSTLPFEKKQDQNSFSRYGDSEKKPDAMTSYKAIIDFDRAGEILPSGLLAMARIVTKQSTFDRCLPWNAIEIDAGKPFIQAYEEGKGWSRMPVEIGKRGRYDVEVKTTIAATAVISSKLW